MTDGLGSVFIQVDPRTTTFAAELEKQLDVSLRSIGPEAFAPLEAEASAAGAEIGAKLGVAASEATNFTGLESKAAAAGEAAGVKAGEGVAAGLRGAGSSVEGIFGNLKAIAPSLAVFAGTTEAIKGVKDAVNDAAQAEKIAERGQLIFGQGYDEIKQKAESAATTLGLSDQDYQNAAATLGLLGQKAGLTGTQLSDFTSNLLNRTLDLSTAFNVNFSQALKGVQSGLAGNTRGLRQFGILLSTTELQNEALRLGLIKTTGTALTPQQKVLATNALILADTDKFQGQFKKHSGDLAEQEMILSAQLKNVAESLGAKLGPAIVKVLGLLVKIVGVGAATIQFFDHNHTAALTLATVLSIAVAPALARVAGRLIAITEIAIGKTLQTASEAFLALTGAEVEGTVATGGFAAALEALNIDPVIAAITALAAVAAYAAIKIEEPGKSIYQLGQAAGNQLVANLNDANTSIQTTTDNTDALVKQLQTLKTEQASAGQFAGAYSKQIGAVSDAIAAEGAAGAQERSNVAQLSAAYGASATEIQKVATANGVSLAGSYETVSQAISPLLPQTAQLAVDTKTLGSAASGSSASVDALNNSVSDLLDNFIGVKQAEDTFDENLNTLITDLKTSHDSIKTNTAAGLQSRDQYLETASSIGQVAEAMEKAGVPTGQIHEKLKTLLGDFADTPAGGKLVTDTMDHIKTLIGQVGDKAPAAGAAVGKGFTDGIVANVDLSRIAGKVEAAVSTAYHSALASLGNLFDFSGSTTKRKTAAGGYFDRPTALEVGEAGPEVVVPLSPIRRGRAEQLLEQSGLMSSNDQRKAGAAPTINVYPQTADPYAVAVSVVNRLTAGIVDR